MWSLRYAMAYTNFLVYFLLIFGQQHISEAKSTGSKVFKNLGNLKDVVKTAMTLGEACEWLDKKMHHIDSEFQRDEVKEKLDHMNLKFDTIRSDISFLQSGVYAKLEEMAKIKDLNAKMNELEKKIVKIDFLYDQLLIEANPETVHVANVTNGLVEDFTNSANGITWRLTEIHNLLLRSHDKRYILKSLADQSLAARLICQTGQSSQQMIHNLYKRIALAEIKGFVMLKWAFGKLSENSTKNTTHMVESKNFLITRLSTTLRKVKEQMKVTSGNFYQCDPNVYEKEYWINGKNYATFGPFLQTYVMYSSEAGTNAYNCKECSTHKAVTPTCFTDLCDQNRFSEYACRGIARNCRAIHKELSICKSTEQGRKYEYIETGEKEKLGRKISCPNDPFKAKSNMLMNFQRCDYCVCTCENTYKEFVRYFDTREVTSDVENNKVITGAQLVTKKDVFYIKIWQGELNGNGTVDGMEEKSITDLKLEHNKDWNLEDIWNIFNPSNTSVNNKEAVREGYDYYYLSWENRTFYLDDLSAPANHVLTGLKFEAGKDHIRLAIRVTPFDFETGELQKDKSRWISNTANLESRNELKLADLEVPTLSFENVLDSSSNQYLRLDTTGLEQDAGQNVVPFVDIQPVASEISTPFAGAGLMHKGSPGKKHGGFLALKLITYDFSPHLVLDVDTEASV